MKNEKTMVYFIVNRFQIARLKEIVHETDPHAFITISEIADVTILLNQILYLAKDYTVFDLDKRLNDNIEYKLRRTKFRIRKGEYK